ncbi:MAG: aminotransferase class I/II-fold pyridoxal phosphate-dependent enzyme [Pseudomonadota bacterium]
MDFDTDIKRRQTACASFKLEAKFGWTADDAIPMWIADSDFATAPCVNEALSQAVAHGAYSYGYDRDAYHAAVVWWMGQQLGWQISPDWVVPAQGLGHAIATALDIWSEPGEGVCYFTPVYHEFRLKTERAHRRPVPMPMALVDGRYVIDWDAAEAAITPDTRVLLFCSPQNPSGRIWTVAEQRLVAAFAAKHDLILISDEVHADLLFGDAEHVPMDVAAPEHRDRTITLHAASKAFNLAGLRVGQYIISDPALREKVIDRMTALNFDPSTLGILATTRAFSPLGAEWLAAQLEYLDGNRRVFDDGINAIPGLKSMALHSTFLPWVDFAGTGMSPEEITARIHGQARIGSAPGTWFGPGGETFHRFNLAMPRAWIEDCVTRMQHAFSDLQ